MANYLHGKRAAGPSDASLSLLDHFSVPQSRPTNATWSVATKTVRLAERSLSKVARQNQSSHPS